MIIHHSEPCLSIEALHKAVGYNIAEVILRKAVDHWAKKCPEVLDMHTHIFVNGKRYLIHIHRCDYKDFEPQESEVDE